MLALLTLLIACAPDLPLDETVPWSKVRAPLASVGGAPRGWVPLRAIVHLHSPYSHDACDGEGWVDGSLDEDCLADLRAGLCDAAIDVAFVTDHPNHASWQSFSDLLLARGDDVPIERGGRVIGNEVRCASGHRVAWRVGIEDGVMPVALEAHVHDDAEARHRLYNGTGAESVEAVHAAGGAVFVPHIESRAASHLEALQTLGALGVEIFNLHAMFAPNLRAEHLGLDPWGWLADASPFIDPDGTTEPDLLFLAVLQDQAPSLAKWDALLARGPSVGVAGTDAHQNTIPAVLRDGERGDSYRRMLSWFSNVLLAESADADAAEAALRAGRAYVAFEALGTPRGFDFRLVADGQTYEMGSDAPPGVLVVGCPRLAPGSPRGVESPEILVHILRDGHPWATGCGLHPADGPAVYRVQVDVVPHHLRPFLGPDPEPWLRPYPWLRSNPIRVHQ